MGATADKLTLLSFDAEEFDIPREFGATIDPREQFRVGAEGWEIILNLLDDLEIRATFFTTAALAERHPALVRRAALAGHEIASHGFHHSSFETADLDRSRRALAEVAGDGVEVIGFRRPRMAPTDPRDIADAGYMYNASENPIWLPGRYNKFFARRRWSITRAGTTNILTLPAAATPLVRWPLFWLSFKNAPLWWTKLMTRWVLAADGYAALYFHPWEFTDLSGDKGFGLPGYVRRVHGERLLSRLRAYLTWLKSRTAFATYGEFAKARLAEKR